MKLYVIGDSWCVNKWPELLAKDLGFDLINDSVLVETFKGRYTL